MSTNPPLACDLSLIDENNLDQHRQNGEAVFEAISEIREIEDGFEFKLPAETELIQTVSSFVARERLCCPFFEFTLSIPSNHQSVWLQLSGGEDVKSYIKDTLLPRLDVPVQTEKQSSGEPINPGQKVAGLLDQYPETYHVFRKYGCPDMRDGFFSLMARIMSVRNAARIHRIPLDELLDDLEAAISENRQQITIN